MSAIHPRRARAVPAVLAAAAALIASALAVAPSASAIPAEATATSCPWVTSKAPIAQRVDQVLARMTLAQKLQEVHGDGSDAYAGTIPAIPELCVPALTLDDSPAGVGHGMSGVTQLPAPVAAASTWDTQLTKQYGKVIGSEQWGKGNVVDLGPTVNIVRDPRWGRAFEAYSEDPYLTGQIGAADIDGIQSTGEMAQVKHLAVYNQETNRNSSTDNAVIDQRTEQEIYLSQFGDIIKQSNPSSVMCSYSYINGQAACQDPYVMQQVLRKQWDYQGFVTSDWGATHSTMPSVKAGMDMEMATGQYYGDPLVQALAGGQATEADIDNLVRPTLTQMFRFHLFTRQPTGTPDTVVTTPAHRKVGRQVAEDGTVLLKNQGGILPLSPSKKSSIAVIGDDAGPNALTSGGGSAAVRADSIVTPYDGIAKRAGKNVTVTYSQGDSSNGGLPLVPSNVLTPSSGSGNGLTVQYYDGTAPAGSPVATGNVDQVAYRWNGGSPAAGVPGSNWSAKYTGTLTAPSTGTYTFSLNSDDGSRLILDGKTLIDNWHDQGGDTAAKGTVDLTAGQKVAVELDYYQGGGGSSLQLGWQAPGGPATPLEAAVAAAKASDTAIVFASNNGSEGSDLSSIDLPADQNELIQAVAAANPHTIVVLNTGSAVTMPWLDSVEGVFEAWYPGQDYGSAIAALLFGDVNPSGKLPVTFPKSLADVPAATPAQWPGVDGKVAYSEGLNVGYRWYDTKDIAPQFAFGSGLSYTSFEFSDLKVSKPTTTSLGSVKVGVDVTNTGERAGSDVVQLYVGDPAATGEPSSQLKGFQKVDLKADQTKHVTLTLPATAFRTWNTTAQAWQVADGAYQLMVGDASDHLPLQGTVRVTRTYGPQGVTLKAPSVLPSGHTQITGTFINGSDLPVTGVVVTPGVPAGWKISPANVTLKKVPPHTQQTVAFTLTPPQQATPGTGRITLDATFHEQSVGNAKVAQAGQDVSTPYPSFAAAFNNKGVSDNAAPTAANFDGSGYSYSAQNLAAAGITPGGTVTSGGATFNWPQAQPGTADNIATAGQVVPLAGSGTQLHVLGAGGPGSQSGDIIVTYTDGTTSTGRITLNDWWANSASPGSTLVATTKWNQGPTGSGPHDVSLYATSIPVTAGKTVAYLTLPDLPGLHLFAASVS
ncbi:glycoside hydrolase family 3 C-terminal domain-containing protein [Streptomyces sp. V4-01]|uniref:Glycoside hydrolase family 3 C-terminal domain-containing protein n=1 Tax=Actinacidiphila polyblastidii TaxID=3110430 RepID=A0ABU7PD80_9ACTN|nr:glycoside hydrolase family 3 C-terminal domain-containing protein [Streptomyces sp. V4-01]